MSKLSGFDEFRLWSLMGLVILLGIGGCVKSLRMEDFEKRLVTLEGKI